MKKSFICPLCKNEAPWHQKSRKTQQGSNICLSCTDTGKKNIALFIIKNILILIALLIVVFTLATLILFTTNSWAALCLFLGFFFWVILSNRIGHLKKKSSTPSAKPK